MFHDQEQVSLSVRALSHIPRYKKKFTFLNFKNAPKEITGQFGVEKVPKLVAVFRKLG